MSSQSYLFAGIVVTIVLAIFSYVVKLHSTVTKVETQHIEWHEQHSKQLDKIDEIEKRLDTAIGQMEVYFKMIDKYLVAAIHSPRHQDRDALMDKLAHGSINEEELTTLSVLLEHQQSEETDPNKKFAGALALARVTSLLWKMRKENGQ